ncbi:50S ribosomal protein L5 [Candidatus Parcubacteria bacterium]|nr:50S ribosomal protein L5 [Candidatus Parcubacteria bacterium]
METVKQKLDKVYDLMKDEFGYKNKLAAPKIEKIIVSVGTGKQIKLDKNKNEFIQDRIAKITGQKPAIKQAKKSIATFKLREGDPIGVAATLRGERMYSFFDKLINVAFPRTKDFRGVNNTIIDDMGNATIGIKENSIFPETGEEELRDVFGFAVTIVTTAKTKKEAKKFFELIGIPFAKVVEAKKK